MSYTNRFETTFYLNGQKKSQQGFRGDLLHGVAISWHPNGVVSAKGKFRLGLRHGYWEWRNTQGVRTSEGFFCNGKIEGRGREWYGNGRLMAECDWKKGEPHGVA